MKGELGLNVAYFKGLEGRRNEKAEEIQIRARYDTEVTQER